MSWRINDNDLILPHTVSRSQGPQSISHALVGNILELAWGAGVFLPELVGKLSYRDDVSNAESEAHLDCCSVQPMLR